MTTRRRYLSSVGLLALAGTVAALPGSEAAAAAPSVRTAGDDRPGAGVNAGPQATGPGDDQRGPTAPNAAAAELRLVARRTKITLPELPTLGITYVALFDLFDQARAKVGTAAAGSSVVDLTPAGPVVLSGVVLTLKDGQIHYQRLINRFGGYPRQSVGAVLGGTGAYGGARGEVGIVWPDADTIELTVRLAA